ncbi:PepSY domain-containing protein [Sporosarcina sp. FSL K6-1522]|uniref:PepSY domain-containing protein n=1 Tax=Sporosarcina sp. FSL K6-1522 TaxID=2921554 RepID=UPI00315B207E
MRFLKKPWFILAVIAVVLLVGGVFLGNILMKKEPLPEADIRSQLESRYGGTVERLSMRDGVYSAEMLKSGALYELEIDAVTGSVLALNQTGVEEPAQQVLAEADVQKIIAGKYSGTIERMSLDKSREVPVYEVKVAQNQELLLVNVDALSGEILSETVKETSVEHVLITKEQAIDIALGQLKGEVDYVTYEKTSDGGFYLIEIDGEDEEAEFQIHAISGKILSTVWDD